jgi:hypothetical protein
MQTNFATQCDILAKVWLENRTDEQFEDFFEYNDLGLPLAYFISNGIVSGTPQAEEIIQETFDSLLETLEIEDTGFDGLEEMLP